jgi:hypothetical protein
MTVILNPDGYRLEDSQTRLPVTSASLVIFTPSSTITSAWASAVSLLRKAGFTLRCPWALRVGRVLSLRFGHLFQTFLF